MPATTETPKKADSLPGRPSGRESGEPSRPVLRFDTPDCKLSHVVVYVDRAEVCRSVPAKLVSGENEVVLQKLSEWIDKDSVRVEGKGTAVISEVTYQSQWVNEAPTENEQVKKARLQIEALDNSHKVLSTKLVRLKKQRSILDGFADRMVSKGSNSDKKEGDSALPVEKSTMDGVVEFFNVYDRQASKLDDGIHDVNRQLDAIKDQKEVAQKNLNELNAEQTTKKEIREVSILLDAAEPCEVELLVSYVVSKALWTPKYDIRVFSNENKMKIQYYGVIQQATGEDWDDAKLSLTTAMPSIGGTVPDLGTQKCFFKSQLRTDQSSTSKQSNLQRKTKHLRNSWSFGAHDRSKAKKTSSSDEGDVALIKYTEIDSDVPQNAALPIDMTANEVFPSKEEEELIVIPVPEVKDSLTSTTYEVARRSSIPCDNTCHKVSVALLDLTATFEYICIPKKVAHAYLKAKVKNTSQYALLSGPTNIFLDNNFVAKSELKAVSPSEEFTCSLGVDPAVRVNYKPLHKYREQSGVINKTISTTNRQDIEIKNSHQEEIHVQLIDQLPLSSEEKIKVNLVEPNLKHLSRQQEKDKSANQGVRLNKQNNIEWSLDIPAGETKDVCMKYTIEHPVNNNVDFSVVYEGFGSG